MEEAGHPYRQESPPVQFHYDMAPHCHTLDHDGCPAHSNKQRS